MWWGRLGVDLDVVGVTRDGLIERWRTEKLDNAIRIKIGSSERVIPAGEHTYVLTYRTGRQIGFFADHDELYWNVTGNFWRFPIDHVTATIKAPDGATIDRSAAYTGAIGARDAGGTATSRGSDRIVFATTRTLAQGEGLTVAVGWPKGFVVAPRPRDALRAALSDNLGLVVAVLGLVLVVAYYAVTWWNYGRDPEAGTIIAQYDPPAGLSAPGCRYVSQMEWDDKAFTCAIVDMAARGFLTMEDAPDDVTILKKTGNTATAARLSAGERDIADCFFGKDWSSMPLRPERHAEISAAIAALKDSLAREHDYVHFLQNRSIMLVGIVMSILCVVASIALSDDLLTEGIGAAIYAGLGLLVYFVLRRWTRFVREAPRFVRGALVFLIFAAFALLRHWGSSGDLFAGFTYLEHAVFSDFHSPAFVIFLLLFVVNLIFLEIMQAPTALGRKLMDHVAGLREYMMVAEQDRLNFAHPPEMTPARFEALLPYAIALDVENAWGEQFSRAMSRLAREGGKTWTADDYTPSWYGGYGGYRWSRHTSWSGFTGDLAQSIVTASTAPSQASGLSSLGGFSGGGGGGGGW